jgi:hypothetical protein
MRGYRLISALVITPVGAYFLWPSPSGDAHHGHEEHHEEHHEEAEAKEEEQPQEEESKDEEPKEEESKDETPDEKHPQEEGKDVSEKSETEKTQQPSGTEGESQSRADGNKKSSGDEEAEVRAPTSGPASTEGVSGKGHMKNDSDGHNQSSKREPDGKGGFKNRKDSGLQKDLTPSPDDSESNSVSFFILLHFQSHQINALITSTSRVTSPRSRAACPTPRPGTPSPSTSRTRRARSPRAAPTLPRLRAPSTPTDPPNRRCDPALKCL